MPVFTWMDTPVGRLKLVASDAGLEAALFESEREDRVRPLEDLAQQDHHALLQQARTELQEYFKGTRQRFEVRVSPRGTPFQQACWEQLQKIPYGSTATYGQQAARLGAPGKARAAGAANGKNPVAIVIPCHRVIASNGTLCGFAAGLDVKRWLLNHEAQHATDVTASRWQPQLAVD